MQEFQYKTIDDGTLCVMSYRGDEAEVTILPEYGGVPVTTLGDGLFSGHSEITALHIPDCVTDFGEFLFDGCTGLRQLKLPAGLERLWGYSFVRSSLEEVVLPDRLQSIPPFAFKDCRQLRRVVCGAGMKQIHAWAFGGCDQLTVLDCGPGVKISPQAFASKELNT